MERGANRMHTTPYGVLLNTVSWSERLVRRIPFCEVCNLLSQRVQLFECVVGKGST